MMASVLARCAAASGSSSSERRLVGDQRADPPGMPRDQRQPGHRPAAGPEHVGRLGAEVVEDRVDVVGALLDACDAASGSSTVLAA